MTHDVWCSQPSPQPDREGLLKCPTCHFLADVAPGPRVMPASNYRCREHPDQPVSWKGRNCPACAAATLKTAAAKRVKREATAARDDTTERQYLT